MKEYKITENAIQNIVTLLNELPFKQVSHLVAALPKGEIALYGVSELNPPVKPEEKKDDTGNKNKH